MFRNFANQLLPSTSKSIGLAANHFFFREMSGRVDSELGASYSLYQVLNNLAYLKCSDVRDKIFGLLGLTNIAIAVDYSKSSEQIFEDTLSLLDAVPDNGQERAFLKLGREMGVQEVDFHVLHRKFLHAISSCEQCVEIPSLYFERFGKDNPSWLDT